jgi:FkbM family methyltransferase
VKGFLKQKTASKSRAALGPFVQSNVTLARTAVEMVTHKDDAAIGGMIRGDRPMCPMIGAELDLLAEIVKPGDSYLDIGANIGITSIPLVKSKPGLLCCCFEPDDVNYSVLTINTVINGVAGHMACLNVALGATHEYIRIYKSPNNFGDHRSHAPRGGYLDEASFTTSKHLVWKDTPARALQAVGMKRIDVVKIDTQGADAEILAGLVPLLRPGSLVLFELSPYHLATNGTTAAELDDLFRQFGGVQKINDLTHRERLENVEVPSLVDYFASHADSYSGHIDVMLTR